MIKKLLTILALSGPAQASLIPYDLEIKQNEESKLVEILLDTQREDINLSQIYLKNPEVSFRELDLLNPNNERYRLFTNSMRMYDTSSNDIISFSFTHEDIINSLEVGVGYYNLDGYNYEKSNYAVEIIENKKISSVSEPYTLGMLALGLYCMYRQREDKSYEKLRKMK